MMWCTCRFKVYCLFLCFSHPFPLLLHWWWPGSCVYVVCTASQELKISSPIELWCSSKSHSFSDSACTCIGWMWWLQNFWWWSLLSLWYLHSPVCSVDRSHLWLGDHGEQSYHASQNQLQAYGTLILIIYYITHINNHIIIIHFPDLPISFSNIINP